MIKIFFLFLFVFIVGCSNEKQVYWCGDHECANKNERIKFFKENLIVEVKVKNSKPEAKSKISKIIEQKNKQVTLMLSYILDHANPDVRKIVVGDDDF